MIKYWVNQLTEVATRATKRDHRIACPFCGSEYITSQDLVGLGYRQHACETCGARGPIANDLIDSRTRWNSRIAYRPEDCQ